MKHTLSERVNVNLNHEHEHNMSVQWTDKLEYKIATELYIDVIPKFDVWILTRKRNKQIKKTENKKTNKQIECDFSFSLYTICSDFIGPNV